MQTLRHVITTLEYVKSKNVEVRFHGRAKNEASHYCGQCEVSKNSLILDSIGFEMLEKCQNLI